MENKFLSNVLRYWVLILFAIPYLIWKFRFILELNGWIELFKWKEFERIMEYLEKKDYLRNISFLFAILGLATLPIEIIIAATIAMIADIVVSRR